LGEERREIGREDGREEEWKIGRGEEDRLGEERTEEEKSIV